MPAILSNATSFLLNTDFSLDKIVYLNSGTSNFGGLNSSTTIPHGLPFVPLVGGYWSQTTDFTTNYEFYSGTFPSGNNGYLFAHEVDIQADATNIYLPAVNTTGGTPAYYYRIFAFEPDTADSDLTPISVQGDNFVLNTDHNYYKLFSADHYSLGTGSSKTVTHNLGYIPRVLAWYTRGNLVSPLNLSSDTFIQLEVNTTSIVFNNPTGQTFGNIYWRIYLDD